jgi:flagellar biosynthesis protein FliP
MIIHSVINIAMNKTKISTISVIATLAFVSAFLIAGPTVSSVYATEDEEKDEGNGQSNECKQKQESFIGDQICQNANQQSECELVLACVPIQANVAVPAI